MRTRLLSTFALITLAVLGFASTATAAQKPIPSIKTTPEFRQLKGYVATLFAKRNVQTTNAKKGVYKANLKTRRTKANLKASSLYNRRVIRISKQDDNKQRRAIGRLRHTGRIRVANLNATLTSRLNRLNAQQNVAVDGINRGFAVRIDPNTRKRGILQTRLRKTTNPAKRAKITAKITAVQNRINKLVNARQAAANAVVARYNARASNVKGIFAGRISSVKASIARQIKRAKNAYKRLYRQQLAAARQKKTADVTLITSVRDRGAGYIEQMPVN
ncbi:MAG: hypothetical protein JJE13_01150 [Thermoleophilia bacterium]|nr:hypothetical protein [Thermoleophilia bacterium]